MPIAERLPAADFVARELVVDKRAALTAETSSRVRSRRSGERVVISLSLLRIGASVLMKYWELIADNLSKAGWSWVAWQ